MCFGKYEVCPHPPRRCLRHNDPSLMHCVITDNSKCCGATKYQDKYFVGITATTTHGRTNDRRSSRTGGINGRQTPSSIYDLRVTTYRTVVGRAKNTTDRIRILRKLIWLSEVVTLRTIEEKQYHSSTMIHHIVVVAKKRVVSRLLYSEVIKVYACKYIFYTDIVTSLFFP